MLDFLNSYSPYLSVACLAVLVLLAVWLAVLHRRLNGALKLYETLTRGMEAGNMQDLLAQQVSQFQKSAVRVDVLEAQYRQLAADMQRSIQRVGVVRFNPFQDVGGDQSFAIALLDARGNGLLLTSLYGRTERRLYVKPILANASPYQLSEEELECLRKANDTSAAGR